MQKYFILFFLNMTLNAAGSSDPYIDYQKRLSKMEDDSGKTDLELRTELLKNARKQTNGISEEDYKFLKGTSAFAASGAGYAQKRGIKGAGVNILLLEDSGITHQDVRTYVERDSPTNPIFGFEEGQDHGSSMASLIHAIAPSSAIRVKPINDYKNNLINVRIINASFGDDKPDFYKTTFQEIPRDSDVLIVKAAGNSQENLSKVPSMNNCDLLIPLSIFAGNLRQDYKGKTSSGFPGSNKKFQDSFLWVIADEIFTASGPENSNQYSPKSGTSNAAAILSGAAALILSKYPSLTTALLKEILLESANRDIFQLFGSGYDAVHVEDPLVNIIQKLQQYKKSNPGKSTLDFAELLADSGEIELALQIIAAGNGVGGINPRPATNAETDQYKRILEKLVSNGMNTNSINQLPFRTGDQLEKDHRTKLLELASKIAPSASPAPVKKPSAYDPAFWGKGVLNIKNALLYAQLKDQNPSFAPGILREKMLQKLNEERQLAAKKIQDQFKNRKHKLTENEIDNRESLTVNTSLSDRKFDKALGKSRTQPIQDETDQDMLNRLGIKLPDVADRKKMKIISGIAGSGSSSSTSSDITPISDKEIPIGAPAALATLLKSDKHNIFKNLSSLYINWLKHLIDMSPEKFANEVVENYPKLLQPFKANIVINLGKNYNTLNSYNTMKYKNQEITLVDLLHDAAVNQNCLDYGSIEDKKMLNFAIALFNRLKQNDKLSKELKSGILSLLYKYRTHDTNDTKLSTFIVDNDLLDTVFNYLEDGGLEKKQATDIINAYQFIEFLKTAKPDQKSKIKEFFANPVSTNFSAEIASQLFSKYFYEKMHTFSSPDFGNNMQKALEAVLSDIKTNAPNFYAFFNEYAKANSNFISAFVALAELRFLSDASERKEAMAQQLAIACQAIR